MRTRDLKPGFFRNERLAEMTPHARILYQGLWCIADKRGRLKDSAALIKADVFPFEKVPVDKLLGQLEDAGFIRRYEVGGERCIWIPKFLQNQHPHQKEPESRLPPHPDDDRENPGMSGESPGKVAELPEQDRLTSNHQPLTTNTLASNLSPPTTDPVGLVCAAFAKFGKVTSGTGQAIEEDVEDLSLDWVQRAVKVAARAGYEDKPSWAYVHSILERWKAAGEPDDNKPKEFSNGRATAHQRGNGKRAGVGHSDDPTGITEWELYKAAR